MSDDINLGGGNEEGNTSEPNNSTKEGESIELTPKGEKKEGNESGEGKDKLFAGKYKTAEELASAYKELESKLGRQEDISKYSTDELANYFKKHYGQYEFKSQLDGELGELSSELAKKTGVPAPIADFMASESVSRVVGAQANINKNEVTKMLADDKLKDAFVTGVETAGLDVKEVQTRLNKGQMSVAEVKGFAAIGQKAPEAELKEANPSGVDNVSVEKAYEEIEKLTRVDSPYWNESHPEYLDTKRRVNHLREKYLR